MCIFIYANIYISIFILFYYIHIYMYIYICIYIFTHIYNMYICTFPTDERCEYICTHIVYMYVSHRRTSKVEVGVPQLCKCPGVPHSSVTRRPAQFSAALCFPVYEALLCNIGYKVFRSHFGSRHWSSSCPFRCPVSGVRPRGSGVWELWQIWRS